MSNSGLIIFSYKHTNQSATAYCISLCQILPGNSYTIRHRFFKQQEKMTPLYTARHFTIYDKICQEHKFKVSGFDLNGERNRKRSPKYTRHFCNYLWAYLTFTESALLIRHFRLANRNHPSNGGQNIKQTLKLSSFPGETIASEDNLQEDESLGNLFCCLICRKMFWCLQKSMEIEKVSNTEHQ